MTTTIAVLGGGQLARMTANAAYRLGVDVGIVARKDDDSPALALAARQWVGRWEDRAILDDVAKVASVVTLENEFVDAEVLRYLEQKGVQVRPSSRTLATVQDKFEQKSALQRAGLPVPRLAAVGSVDDVLREANVLGWPMMLKSRRNGYDGYGNELLRTPEDVPPAFHKLCRRGELMAEEFVPFTRELAIMVARNAAGEEATYPVVETIQHAHMCHTVLAPADVSPTTARHAEDLARRMMSAIDGVGIFGLELFLLNDGELLINEIAPRPHNSGHFTMEACATSQFENHVRAILGMPLGSTKMSTPAAVMVNVLGSHDGEASPQGLSEALRISGATVHLYGKRQSRPGRKMGHVTALGSSVTEARELALRAARSIHI